MYVIRKLSQMILGKRHGHHRDLVKGHLRMRTKKEFIKLYATLDIIQDVK